MSVSVCVCAKRREKIRCGREKEKVQKQCGREKERREIIYL